MWRQALETDAPPAELGYDVGCGSGVLTVELAARVPNVIAIDGSQAMLDIAAQFANRRTYNNIVFIRQELPPSETTSLKAGQIVISSSAVEYLESLKEALLFVRALLVPAGIFIFSVSNRDSINRKIVRTVNCLTGRPRYLSLVRHFLCERDIRQLLDDTGFDYVRHSYFEGRDRLNRSLSLLLPPRLSSNMILVVARRRI